MSDYNLEDYSGIGMLGGLVKGAAQGLMQGQEMADRREDRKLKQLEFDAKMKAEDLGKEKKIKEDTFNRSEKLRDDWLKNKSTTNSQSVQEAYSKIKNAGQSAAGDLSLIYGFMRMQDPQSTVREGEFATAQNSAGLPDQVRNMYNRIRTGERLNPVQRQQFIQQAGQIYSAQQQNQGKLDDEFRGIATRAGVSPEDVVLKIWDDPQTGEKKIVKVPAGSPAAQSLPDAPKQQQAKPKGLLGGKQAKPKDKFESMSDQELERLYKQKMGGG